MSGRLNETHPRIRENRNIQFARELDIENDVPHEDVNIRERGGTLPSQIQSPKPLGVVFMVEDRGSMSAYGPSSAFHFQSSPSTAASPVSNSHKLLLGRKSSQSQPESEVTEQIRMHLVASAAIARQDEGARLLHGQCDFDGLDLDVARHLLDIHWNRHHCMFPLSYRPLVMQDLLKDGQNANKLLWNAIFYSSSLQSDRMQKATLESNGESLKDRFYRRFNNLLTDYLDKSSAATVAALLLMGSSLVTSGKHTSGWLYCGLAYRMIIDLGIHLDSQETQMSQPLDSSAQIMFTQQELEMRRRLYWTAYAIDKFQSLYFGRPAGLTAIGVEPSQSFSDTYEELELWVPYIDPLDSSLHTNFYRAKPAYPIATFRALVQLAEISYDIIRIFYLPLCSKISPTQANRSLNDLRKQLDSWLAVVPPYIQYDPDKDYPLPPHQLTLHTTFHTLQILLHRPFLPKGHLSQLQIEGFPFRGICTSSALQIYKIARAYEETFTFKHAPYLFSYALFSAATVIPPQEDQLEVIRFFCRGLAMLQRGTNLGLRKPLLIIRDLMERAGVNVNSMITAAHKEQHVQQYLDQIPRQDRVITSPEEFAAPFPQSDISRVFDDLAAQDVFPEIWNDDPGLFQYPANVEAPEILYGMFE
jgi:hypothetical protein